MVIDLLLLLNQLIAEIGIKSLSDKLNVCKGTIQRWIELEDVPCNYEFDLLKLSNIDIDYSKYTSKQKDQFYTPLKTASLCFEIFQTEIIKYEPDFNIEDFQFIEPSAGDGNFLKVLPKNTIAIDVEPRGLEPYGSEPRGTVIKKDYLDWLPTTRASRDIRYIVFGNPPFGLRGHMALKFINHSSNFAEYVCFILPQLFESDGKGVPRKRVKEMNLIFSKKIESNFYEPDKNEVKINTIFQIWSRDHKNSEYDIKKYGDEKMKIYSMSDGGTVSSTRNKNMIGKCDTYLPSTCFGKENMKCYENFEDLPGKKGYGILFKESDEKNELLNKMLNIVWNDVAFMSTNSAYNLRSSQIHASMF